MIVIGSNFQVKKKLIRILKLKMKILEKCELFLIRKINV